MAGGGTPLEPAGEDACATYKHKSVLHTSIIPWVFGAPGEEGCFKVPIRAYECLYVPKNFEIVVDKIWNGQRRATNLRGFGCVSHWAATAWESALNRLHR